FSVPTFYARLLQADLPSGTFASVRLAVSAGERLPEELHAAWRARFGVEILDGIGATETIFMVLSNRPGQSRPGSSGLPVPGTGGPPARRRRRRGPRRRRGRPPRSHGLDEPRLLAPRGGLAPRVRGRVVLHRRRLRPRHRWLLPPPRAPRRPVQGRGPVGVA